MATMFRKLLRIMLVVNLWIDSTSGEILEAIVHTGDHMFASTEAKIEIEIFGTEGHKGRTILHGYFNRNTTETTRFGASIGEPYQIIVYHDGSGIQSSWYLDWIKLKNRQTNREYRFVCNCWLDGERKYISGDTKVCRNIPQCHPGHKVCRTSPDDSRCSLCDDPYYSGGWKGGCRLCPSISKCTDRYCTSSSNVKCRRCQDNIVSYKVSSDSRRCDDINECTANATNCEHMCNNTLGSYRCGCRNGYQLDSNGYSCKDTNECVVHNGGCSHTCVNEIGSYHCTCPRGYTLTPDDRICKDVDECAGSRSACSQKCVNTIGSFSCGCEQGYQLARNGINCIDIDDCIGVTCQHGGHCLDGLASYTCSCPSGYTGRHCEQDVNECSGIYNGGCEETCVNTLGSFRCQCTGNKTLLPDGLFCSGGPQRLSVFRRHNIVRQLLPRGCSTIELTRCTDGTNVKLSLSSTSPWYRLKSNFSIIYTQGIVFVELSALSLPVSLTGMKVSGLSDDFTMTTGSLQYTPSDGILMSNDSRPNCWSFSITPRDIHDFLTSMSFISSFFDNLQKFLPAWLSFSHDGNSLFQLSDLKTELKHGSDIVTDPLCKGAPVLPSHLYSIFKFGGSMSVSVYGDKIMLPNPLAGERFCFVVDICQDYGGSMFLMIPEQSRDLLEKFMIFKNLKNTYDLEIRPRGIGLSLLRHINVHSQTTELELWNGDRSFKYPVFAKANVWIGGDARMSFSVFNLKGRTDMFFKMPSPLKVQHNPGCTATGADKRLKFSDLMIVLAMWQKQRQQADQRLLSHMQKLLKSVFLEEWNLLMTTEVTADMAIKFKLFGSKHTIRFTDLGVASVDIYASLGGTQPRQWCGSKSNPPGIFLSMMARVNPFRHIPILKDWVFDLSTRLYVFFATDPGSTVSQANNIDIMTDIVQLDQMITRLTNLTLTTVGRYGVLLANESVSVAHDLQHSLNKTLTHVENIKNTISTNGILNIDFKSVGDSFASIWNDGWTSIKQDTKRFIDSVEFNTRVAKYNFTRLFSNELDRIEHNLNKSVNKLTAQVFSALTDYEGVGFRFTAELHVFHLKICKVELEAVHSVSSLGHCSKFKDAFEIFKSEKSFRFIGIVSTNMVRLGFFLRLDVGGGVGMAFSIDTPGKILLQFHAQASILGISVSTDLLISNVEIYFDIEGKLWNVFKAKLALRAAHGKDWKQLTYHVHGELLGNANKDENFQDSYVDALRKAVKDIGDSATHRITQAQNAITRAQSGLTSAQRWLQSKKPAVRSANSVFDSAVHALDHVKDALERAKGPFNAAVAKLNKAQKHLDSLCKIESCSRVCVPGIRCHICHKKVWFIRIPYPCCHLTRCMFSFPNPFCVVKNIGCRVIRAVAYFALEAAKLFVKVPMLALDTAKVAVSVAQVVVDKSRVVLDIAIAAIDLATVGLEGAKVVLGGAKLALEGVKVVVKVGLKVVNLILTFGLQSLIDAKNCNFDIDISTRSLPVFAVGCDLNAFRLGWRPVRFTVNFNRPIQSLWEAAKTTLKFVIDSIGHALFGRRKRELMHKALLKTHKIIRSYRDVDMDADAYDIHLNETIDLVFETAGFKNTTSHEDYENRVAIFRRRCSQFQRIVSFLNNVNGVLFDIANETYTTLKAAADMHDELETFDIDTIRSNFTLENSGIDSDVAIRDFNISNHDLNNALANANDSLKNDSLLSEIHNTSQLAKSYLKEGTKIAGNIRILDQWVVAMENVTSDYFENDVCVSFLDCAHYSMAELLDLYYSEEFDNVSEIFYLLSSIEDTFLELIGNSSHPIETVYNLSDTIRTQLSDLEDMNPYCSVPPIILSQLTNQTVALGGIVRFYCNVSGSPEPSIWWYQDDEYLPGEHEKTLTLENVTATNITHKFKCVAGNVVANLSSDDAFLNVEDEVPIRPVDEVNSVKGLVSQDTTEQVVLTKRLPSNVNESTDLLTILISTFVSLLVLGAVVIAVLWRCYIRNKFRKDQALGSFASLNMVRPTSAKPVYQGGQSVSKTTVEQMQ